jgi:hypothetical protein
LEKNKDWSGGVLEWWKRIRIGVMEYWSVGLKSGNRSDFYWLCEIQTGFTFFPLYQPFINPLLHHSNTPGTINHLL